MTAPVIDRAVALEQSADDVHRLAEHLVAPSHGGPASAHHVLVEILAGPQPEGEPAVGQKLHRRGFLSHHGRVVATGRARYVGHERNSGRHLGCGAQHGPRVGGMALLLQPRKVMVGDHRVVESGRFGHCQVTQQVLGTRLLAHHGVADLHGLPSTLPFWGQTSVAAASILQSVGVTRWSDRGKSGVAAAQWLVPDDRHCSEITLWTTHYWSRRGGVGAVQVAPGERCQAQPRSRHTYKESLTFSPTCLWFTGLSVRRTTTVRAAWSWPPCRLWLRTDMR